MEFVYDGGGPAKGGGTVTLYLEVSKRRLRLRDSYGIAVAPGQDNAMILAVAVCIDQMACG